MQKHQTTSHVDGRGSRRTGLANAPTTGRAEVILTLVPRDTDEAPPPPRADAIEHTSGDVDLEPLRAERDALREDVEFIHEQLEGVTRYYRHLLHHERTRLLEERRALMDSLHRLQTELHHRMYRSIGDRADARERADASVAPGE